MKSNLNKKIIGVDLGGTKVAAGLVDGTRMVKKNYDLIPNNSKNAQDVIDKIIDVTDKLILPTWCDSHTHIVYAGNRSQEFVDRINGLTYEEIANKGGGILNSAKKNFPCYDVKENLESF